LIKHQHPLQNNLANQSQAENPFGPQNDKQQTCSHDLKHKENMKSVAFCDIPIFEILRKGFPPYPPFTKEYMYKDKNLEGKRRKRTLR